MYMWESENINSMSCDLYDDGIMIMTNVCLIYDSTITNGVFSTFRKPLLIGTSQYSQYSWINVTNSDISVGWYTGISDTF